MGYDVKIQEESEKISRSVLHKSVEIKDRQYGHYLFKKDEAIYIPCGGAVFVQNAITEVPIQMVQQRAGHQDPKITLSVYSHVARDKETLVAEKLNNVLFSAVNQ